MNQLNERAARIQLRGLIAAVILAMLLAIGITAGAFVLSFSVLTDLARQAGIPTDLAFLFPLIVDGAILGATIAAVTLNKISGSSQGKAFFLWLLVAVVCISVAGNAYHAWSAAESAARNAATAATSLAPLPAALIAVIPPLLVLAFTHGISVLIKAIGSAYREAAGVVADQPADVAPVAAEPVPATVAAAPVRPAVVESAPLPEPVAEAVAVVIADPDPVAETVAPVASVAEPVAEVEPVAEAVAEPVADGQTIAELLAFWAASELPDAVKITARLRVENPDWTFARLAEQTNAAAASTALRRYKRAETVALAAGFTAPPLPLDTPIVVPETRELVNA